ncbi:hypothetical protein E0H73_00250 [Kribbella pittospori]|uniref:Sensor domain-containing protein n=1 Tax=Kribbella pittospori TaxID=722689 RepID=A0A4R0L3I2_9ACTN|nr:sensor domain-containing protein [Kribbella pittospori]TCC65418.1 hypothetical protein E0H73_00250 [Kribbella pittospori]
MTRFVSLPLALAAALSLSLTACGGDDKKNAAAPSTPAGTTPAPSVTPSAPKPSGPVTRSSAELTRALLALSDLPTGFSQEKEDPEDTSKPFSSPTSKCKTLVKYLNATEAPGAKASVTRSFSGGQEGPYIDFGLDSMGTAAKVADLRETYDDAVSSCSKVSLKIEGESSTSMMVEEISAPKAGTGPFAFRLTGTSGPKRGLEYTAAITGVNDVIVSVGVLAGQGSEFEAATEAAVTKAQQVLKAG